MRLLIQRVKRASVFVVEKDNISGKIDNGLFVLVGIGKEDSQENARVLAEKLLKLRVMPDSKRKMNLSIKESKGNILIVSQFTLYADTSGGNRPSFINSAPPEKAKIIYDYFIKVLKDNGISVEAGVFGSYMEIDTVLDGPITILLDN